MGFNSGFKGLNSDVFICGLVNEALSCQVMLRRANRWLVYNYFGKIWKDVILD